jgi:hypothetical protein
MICDLCGGKRQVVILRTFMREVIPCPECGGSGVTHCCDGLREQPQTDTDWRGEWIPWPES